jgi:hypothetical protein
MLLPPPAMAARQSRRIRESFLEVATQFHPFDDTPFLLKGRLFLVGHAYYG